MPWSSVPKNFDRHELQSKYGSLAVGVSLAGEMCFACEGGRTQEKTLSVTRTETGVLFNCHRASCGVSGCATFAGAPVVRLSKEAQSNQRVPARARYASLIKESLPADVRDYLRERYGISDNLCARGLLRWTEAHSPKGHGRVVLPILNNKNEPYGYVARRLDTQIGAKAFTFVDDNEGSWYINRNSKVLLIVEDQLSALKASQFVNTVALLGTNITDATLKAIISGQYTAVYLALDKDAFPKSVKLAVELRPQVSLSLIRLHKDIKDLSVVEISELFLKEGLLTKET